MITISTMNKARLDLWIGIVCGTCGGGIRYVQLDILFNLQYWEKLLQAGMTAVFLGFCGVGGKHLFVWMRRGVIEEVKYWRDKKKFKK